MSFRDDLVNSFARLIGAGDFGKAKAAPPPAQATQSANDLPLSWQMSTYAPGWPIQPITRPEDSIIPREIDYPIAVNATLYPRTAYGLMPFAALKEAYESVSEIRLPISTLLREMSVFRPHLVDKGGGEVYKHPYEWLVESPDRVSSWDVWLTRFLKSSLVFDAASFFYEYDGANLNSIRYVDGSTMFIMVDEYGQVPKPNDVSKDPDTLKKYQLKREEWLRKGKTPPRTTPAYCQVIKGTPFAWYDSSQIWYKPRSRRFDAPYGETAIEQAWAWVLICANVTAFQLAHYREGNMPEGWVNAPDGWNLERISAFETAFNARMSSGPSERMRARFLPAGMTWQETKQQDFPVSLYDQALNNISLFFGVPPSEYGKTPGAGLGGKGFEDAMQSSLFRMGLFPLKSFIEGAMNEVLERSGVMDVTFDLAFPTDETDPEKHKQSIIDMMSSGLITFNNALAQLGQDRIEGGDVHLLLEFGSAQILEDILQHKNEPPPMPGAPVPGQKVPQQGDTKELPPTDEGKGSNDNFEGTDPDNPDGKGGGGKGGKPTPPKDTTPQRKEKMTKADYKLAERMIATRSLNPDGKFYSIPSVAKIYDANGNELQTVNNHGNDLAKQGVDIKHIPDHPRDPKYRFASKGKLSDDTVLAILKDAGFETANVDMAQCYDMVDNLFNVGVEDGGDDLEIEKLAKSADDGVMVALDVPESVAAALQQATRDLLPDGVQLLPAGEMHITLFYPGTVEQLSKGGVGSGNFGHSGRIGVRGGSGGGAMLGGGGGFVPANVPFGGNLTGIDFKEGGLLTRDLAEVNSIQNVQDTRGSSEYLLAGDGKMYYTPNGHEAGVMSLNEANGIEAAGKPYTTFFQSGGTRIEHGNTWGTVNTSFETASPTTAALKDWQSLYDAGKLDIPDGKVWIDNATTNEGWQGTTTDFLSATQIKLTPSGKPILKFAESKLRKSFTQTQLLEAVKAFAKAHAPLTGVIGGVARFNGDGGNENPIVALFDCAELPQFRQDLVEFLHSVGIHEVDLDANHGYIPHITLAYVPVDSSMKDDLKIDTIPITFNELTVAWGGKWHYVPLQARVNVQKVLMGDLAKHCGVCPEDEAYYGAPVTRAPDGAVPIDMNLHDFVYMQPDDLPQKIAYWKPMGSENDLTNAMLGGNQYVREAATYLIDRSLSFYLTPVSYVATVNDEPGAVVFYTPGGMSSKNDPGSYSSEWQERAAVLDYITGQIERIGWYAHPDDPLRFILCDNGTSFPTNMFLTPLSPFIAATRTIEFSDSTKRALTLLANDMATWSDVVNLIGKEAASYAYGRLMVLIAFGHIPADDEDAVGITASWSFERNFDKEGLLAEEDK